MIEVELPDGRILEFPEGTSQDVMRGAIQKLLAPVQEATARPEPQRGFGEMLWENIIGRGEVDTPGERLGQLIQENITGRGEVDTPGERLGEFIRGAGAATARGIADVPALPVNVAQIGAMGVEKALGMESPSVVSRGLAALPDTREMLASVPYIGPETEYVAPGTAGEYIATAGEFAGGAGLTAGPKAIARYGVAPGVASEAAGQATEGTDAEPYARAAAGLGASILATPRPVSVGRGVVRPDAERSQAFEELVQQGITPTGGQLADSPALMRAEGTLSATNAQLDAFTKAALRAAGNPTANRATPKVLNKTQRNITNSMNEILDVDVPVTMSAGQRVLQVSSDHFGGTAGKDLPVALRKVSERLLDIATDPAVNNIPAKTMRKWRTILGTYTTSNQEMTREAAHSLRNLIDDLTEETLRQSGRANDIERLAVLRRQYRNFLTIADATTRGGREGASGLLTPERVSSAAKRVVGRKNYATGRATDLADLARKSEMVIGSAPTTKPGGVRDVATAAGLGSAGAYGGFIGGGLPGAIAGGVAGTFAPVLGSAAMRSGPVQSVLTRPEQFKRSIATMPGLLSQN